MATLQAPVHASPLTACLGAEVTGVNLADVDEATFASLRAALLEHKVLVFRDQHISIEQHLAFGRLWGPLEAHPLLDSGTHPELVTLHSTAEKPTAAQRWHSDVTWRDEPSMGSILRARIVPPAGGDTCFADACAAYESLEDEWKERIDGLTAVHDFSMTFGKMATPERIDELKQTFPPVSHPVVRTHPDTGARGIYTNRYFTHHVEGVSAQESTEILDRLERAIASPNVQCRVRWQVDTFVMWDNRCTQHFATSDFWPEERKVERVTVAGDRPLGVQPPGK